MGSLDGAARKVREWAREEFGEEADPEVVARKVMEEARELRAEPESAEEMADLVIAVIRLADVSGVNLRAAVEVQLGKNMERDWERSEDGNWNHASKRED